MPIRHHGARYCKGGFMLFFQSVCIAALSLSALFGGTVALMNHCYRDSDQSVHEMYTK
jgi:hypothetical protein